ncbi:MAG: PHP domain-containing protein [Candidatus Adiutrix sp.]|jgi:predicted metal-dependent phosphoesterase TrpH|nr:PHP domain-containing protein [Candidatus Adiutrix sp.]
MMERRFFDFHTHSAASDGSLTPSELVAAAARAGLAGVALTDHDTVDGLEEFLAAAAAIGLTAVGGVEISLEHPGTMHLLGYNAAGGSGLPASLGRLKGFRLERNRELHEKLAGLGYSLDWERLLAKSGGGQLGRPHFAALLVEEGFFGSTKEVFDRLLGKGQPGYVDKKRMSVEAGLAVITEAGWAPVLAHPVSVTLDKAAWPQFLAGLKERGLAGLEVRHPNMNEEESAFFLKLAREMDLIPTAGSDFHGATKPDIGLDWALHHDFFGGEVLEQLRNR